MAKGIGNGFPMGAVVTTPGMYFFPFIHSFISFSFFFYLSLSFYIHSFLSYFLKKKQTEIAKVLSQKLHFNTYGGNPLPMVVGKKVLELIERDKLQENCLVLGKKLKDGFNQLKVKMQIKT